MTTAASPYPSLDTPHDRLRRLLEDVTAPAEMIDLTASIPNWPLPDAAASELRDMGLWAANPSFKARRELGAALEGWLKITFDLDAARAGAVAMPTSGSKEGLASAIATVLRSRRGCTKRKILVPDGSYHAVLGATTCANGMARNLQVPAGQGLGRCLASMKDQALEDIAGIVFPFPAGPLAAEDTLDDLRAALHVAERCDAVLIADECMLELYHDARPPSFLDLARELGRFPDRLIVSSSLSKRSFASALRSACLVTSEATAGAIQHTRRQISPLTPVAVQLASAHLWADDERCETIRAHLAQSRRLFAAACDGRFEIILPRCGLSGWIRVEDDLKAAKLAAAAGVAAMPASLLPQEPSDAGPVALRIALDGDHDVVAQALHTLVRAISRP